MLKRYQSNPRYAKKLKNSFINQVNQLALYLNQDSSKAFRWKPNLISKKKMSLKNYFPQKMKNLIESLFNFQIG